VPLSGTDFEKVEIVASEHMRLDALGEIFERISATSRKKEKVSLIVGILLQARGEEIALAAHYLSGQIPPGAHGGSLERCYGVPYRTCFHLLAPCAL
jgi:hypothetical protein